MAPPGSAYSEEISARTRPGKVHSAGRPIDARPFKLDTHPLRFIRRREPVRARPPRNRLRSR